MATNVIIVGGSSGGTNVNVVKVLPNHIITGDSFVTAEVNASHELTSENLQTITLPAGGAGDVFALIGTGSGLFRIIQQNGEQILFGITATTAGITGNLASTQINSVVYLRKTATSGLWLADSPIGEFLIDDTTLVNSINNTIGGDDVTLSSTGTGESLVTDGVGPDISVKSIDANLGLTGTTVSGRLVLDASVASIVDGSGISSSTDVNNNVTVTNTAPDQTVVLNNGTGISVTGTYPTFTITNTGATPSSFSYGSIHRLSIPGVPSGTIDTAGIIVTMGGGMFLDAISTEFDQPVNGRLRYTGVDTRKFKITADISTSTIASCILYIKKTGSTIDQSSVFFSGLSNSAETSTDCLIELATNDYVEIFLRTPSGTTSTTLFSASMCIHNITF